ncbi:MAG: septum formation initiator family protein [Pseudomonadota bacterium]
MPVFLKVAIRRIQIRLGRRRSIGWTGFWAYLGLLAFSSVFTNRGLLTSYRLWSERQRLDGAIGKLSAEVNGLDSEVRKFRGDPRTIERYAREELHLVGKNEIQYIFK